MAVFDEVVDKKRDPSLVVERDGTLAGALDHSVEEDRRSRGRADRPVEKRARHPRAGDEQAVDLMREQGLQCCKLPVDVQACVHQHHAVAGLLQPSLRPLERGGVERARDVRNDEPDGEGLLRSQGPCKRRRLEVELRSRVLHGGARCRCETAVPVQGPRGGRRRDACPFGDIGERGLAPGGDARRRDRAGRAHT